MFPRNLILDTCRKLTAAPKATWVSGWIVGNAITTLGTAYGMVRVMTLRSTVVRAETGEVFPLGWGKSDQEVTHGG
jgi:hypothetical protein